MIAVACGIAVANVYYVQPLLALMAHDFGVSDRAAGGIAFAGQLGYAVGIALFIPLGDVLDRRKLVIALFSLSAVMLVATALAPSLLIMIVVSALLGASTIVAQILVPFAADIAPAFKRGRTVAIVQSGLTFGIMFSRVASGQIGSDFGWRSVYWLAAGFSLAAGIVIYAILPHHPPRAALSYPSLLTSLWRLFLKHMRLRQSTLLGAMRYGCFSVFWTTIAFHLARDLHLGANVAGYLALTAAFGGVVAAPLGSLADRRGTIFTSALGFSAIAISFAFFLIGGESIAALAVGTTTLALGMQLDQISNQTRVFALDDTARSRLNTVYIFGVFLGGALGSLVGSWVWQGGGWTAVCIAGFAFAGIGVLTVVRMLMEGELISCSSNR